MPEGVDGVEAGGAAGGHESEEDADGGGEDEGDHVDVRIKQEGRADDFGEVRAEAVGEHDARDSADAGERDGLDEELQQHLAGTGTDGPDFGITRLECAYIYPQNIVSNLNAMAKRGVPILPGEWSLGAASLTAKGPGRLL